MMSEGTPWRVCDLKINGRDLKALGYSGRKLGAVLDEMLLLAANGKSKIRAMRFLITQRIKNAGTL